MISSRPRIVRLPAFLAILAAGPGALVAQEPAGLSAGARIRVTPVNAPLRPVIGRFLALTDGTLRWTTRGDTVAHSLGTIARLERSRGRRLSVAGGVGGFLLGAAAGGALGCLANRDSYGVYCGGQDDTTVFVGAALGGAAGALLGALIFRRERWSAVALPR